jgi:hypothetical protein
MRLGIIGGGIFGVMAAIELSSEFEVVEIFESGSSILSAASSINQARLHTGMHYPRDFKTAYDAWNDYEKFIALFSSAIMRIDQFYGVSASDSKISPDDYLKFANRLGLPFKIVDPEKFFDRERIPLLIQVPEATFDIKIIRNILIDKLSKIENITLRLNTPVSELSEADKTVSITVANREKVNFDRVVISAYSQNTALTRNLEMHLPVYENQLCQVLLVKSETMKNSGITIMDGPFWSLMPYGLTKLHSLTNVIFTPISRAIGRKLECQEAHGRCGQFMLFTCNSCKHRKDGDTEAIINQFRTDTLGSIDLDIHEVLYTVKSIPITSKMDTAARPTEVHLSKGGKVAAIFSGKIGSAISTPELVIQKLLT